MGIFNRSNSSNDENDRRANRGYYRDSSGGRGSGIGSFILNIIKDPFSILRVPFKLVGSFIVILLSLYAFFIIAVISGGSGQAFLKYAEVQIGRVPYGDFIYSKGFGWMTLFIRTGGASILTSDYGKFETAVDANSKNEELGVRISNIRPFRRSYKSGEPVEVVADLKGSSLRTLTNIELNCAADNGDDIVIGKMTPNIVQIGENKKVFTQVKCVFPNGELKTERDIKTVPITIGAKYDFTTKGYLDIWAMSASEKDKYYSLNGKTL